jgi:hypothetical protein
MKKLTEADVRLILTTDKSLRVLSRQLGKSKQTISQVRLGLTHKSLAPDLPRRAASKSCLCCEYWREGLDPCSQGLPDPIDEGPSFASDCDFYELKAKITASFAKKK